MVPEDEKIGQLPIFGIEIGALTLGDSPRLDGEDPGHIEALAVVQHLLPPIVVHRPTMRVIDGAHRVKAALRRGESTIAARLLECSEADAFVVAVRLNVAHGLPLALGDRKRAAGRIITSHPQWSDRRVAAVTGVSPGTVADIRRRVSDPSESPRVRIGQDGRVRPLDGSAGRRLAGQLMSEKPHLSLRQVARAAAISPETARDVRNRLRSGQDLVPDGRRKSAATGGPGDPERRETDAPVLIRRHGGPVVDHAAVVNRLKADPALRYTDNGRNLLRLLTLHSVWADEWEGIVTKLPPHCTDLVADLALEFATLWADFATRAGKDLKRAT